MKRALALVGAILLVAVAVVVRGSMDSDDSNGDDPGGGGGSDLVVACVPELADACEALDADVTIEDPTATIANLDAYDAWVTLDPWQEMAGIIRPGAGRMELATPVAQSDLVLVARSDITGACAEPIDWSCAVEVRGAKAAVGRPTSASGLLVLGWAALQWSAVTRPGEPFARNELDLPEFQTWLGGIDRRTADPLSDALQLGPAGPHVIGTTAADAGRIDGSREEANLSIHPTITPATVAVMVVGSSTDDAAGRIASDDDFTDALTRSGWRLDDQARSSGLPDFGVLVALLQEVS